MPAQQTAGRPIVTDNLNAYKISDTLYFVESSKEKILYKVTCTHGNFTCTCGDYVANSKNDEAYQCKHIQAAQNGAVHPVAVSRPRLNENFITTIQGAEFVKYAGLLDLAHQKGILSLQVEPVQFPNKENHFEAIVKATLESPSNELYVEWGDANPKNVNAKISNHLLRMAATRAKARCFRDYTNIGITCLEELGGDDALQPSSKPEASGKSSGKTKTPPGEVIPMKQRDASPANQNTGENPPKETPFASQAQKKAMENLAQRRGLNLEDMNLLCQKALGIDYAALSSSKAADFIKILQQSA